jgi:membrane-associated protein
MEVLQTLFHYLRHVDELIKWGGYPALMAIIFAETGLLVGFFLPGDSLLVTAGALVYAEKVNPMGLSPMGNLLAMNAILMVMAIAGDAVGFAFGRRAGETLYEREQTFFFRRDHLLSTREFFDKHGGKTIILARFMPFARTFAPIVAGIGKMPYASFAKFNVVGGVVWVSSMTFLGYFLGQLFDAKSIERIVYVIILISVAPPIVAWLKSRSAAKAA